VSWFTVRCSVFVAKYRTTRFCSTILLFQLNSNDRDRTLTHIYQSSPVKYEMIVHDLICMNGHQNTQVKSDQMIASLAW
jgi:hypothetical protein